MMKTMLYKKIVQYFNFELVTGGKDIVKIRNNAE